MEGYVIKVTYLTGSHAGRSHLRRKGGRIADEHSIFWDDEVYTSLQSCKAACTKFAAANKRDHEWELKDREWARSKGRVVHDWMIHELESYEPYKVDTVSSQL